MLTHQDEYAIAAFRDTLVAMRQDMAIAELNGLVGMVHAVTLHIPATKEAWAAVWEDVTIEHNTLDQVREYMIRYGVASYAIP